MGHEYKIVAKLTSEQQQTISSMLLRHRFFDKKYEYNKLTFWDLRQPANTGQLPDLSIVFEVDGLYVCQYAAPDLWRHLSDLQTYLLAERVEYQVADYAA